MWSLRQWRRRRYLRRAPLDEGLWREALRRVPLTGGFNDAELGRLRDLATLFLREKSIEAAAGIQLDPLMRLVIAIQACVPILNLSLDDYRGWHAVIVYPDQFRPGREVTDEDEIVHVDDEWKAGESWERGPVILSWEDVLASGSDGVNLVIHEFAHKLDMQDGVANGAPPLHRGMARQAWAEAFSAAYADFCRRVDRGEDTRIDPYASESPEEFFAVLSEVFFEWPGVVDEEYPRVYQQLRLYYRQDPLARVAAAGGD